MRKIFVTIAALVMALVMSATAFGCNLIQVDNERDMAQVVAVVKVEDGAPEKENTIYKRDLLLAYLNYGYYYEQNYGYTREQTINLIINNLITSRVYLQVAIIDFANGQGAFANQIANPSITDKWDIARYLTADEIVEAEYLTKKSVDDMIHSYEEEHNHGGLPGDTIVETIRTTPTGATNARDKVEDPSIDEMKAFAIDTDSTASRKKAYNKVIDVLEDNNFLGDGWKTIEDTEYYKQTLRGNKEQLLIEKYEKCILAPVHANYDLDDVKDLFNKEYQKQEKWTDAEYSAALSSASATSPILYAPTGTYGYVYNLLLGVSEDQSAEIKEYDSENPNASEADRSKARKEILDKTTVKDLRSTWIMSGYDFDGSKFTGDYTFTKEENSLKFYGETKLLNPEDHDHEDHEDHEHEYVPEYGVLSVDEMGIDAFVKLMEEYVYGAAQDANKVDFKDSSVYRAVKTDLSNDEYNQRINELLFAFSTDGGSMNTYKGYTVSPVPDGSNQEQYMQEFADYGRKVLNGEVGSKGYVMVATDYGYHIMFYSAAYNAGTVYNTLEGYLNGECKELLEESKFNDWKAYFEDMQKNWSDFEETDNYLYFLYNNLVSNQLNEALSKHQTELLNKYYFGENSKVVTYPEVYKDLLG